MRVYRVAIQSFPGEFPTGPYCGHSYKDIPDKILEMWKFHASPNHHRPPNGEIDMFWTENLHSGFISELDMLLWFDDYLYTLGAAGFSIYEYDVPDWRVTTTPTQCVFDRNSAILIRTYPINPE